MSADYTLILRSCPEGHRESAAVYVGKVFSLKEHTCQQIVASAPIVLLAGLAREEAAAMHLLVHGLGVIGAGIELSSAPVSELPKIDWPRRPQVFKRELSEWVADLQIPLPVSGHQVKLIDLLLAALEGRGTGKAEFTGSTLPEVTPFSTPALDAGEAAAAIPPPPTARPAGIRTPLPPPPSAGGAPAANPDDALNRLNELFPEEEGGGFLPRKDDITNILNKILPDEEAGGGAGGATPSRKVATLGAGFSVFLAKITDEERRKKAVPLIAELGKVPPEEAESLSKKMIIPVLRGATKEEAEAAKAQFGKIGILARVKGPE